GSVGFANRLGKVQNIATCLITGAFKTTPIDTLNYMAHIPPIVNRLNHLSFNAATRLATLPPSNPLQKLTRRCVSHVPRCHRSVLHDTFSAFPSLTNLETIVPSVLETTWTPSFSHQIATDKNTALKELSNYSEDLCIFSDGS
ncbi:hypothetical protein FB45DRAFT_685877, partial [Roridomyces roridus]